MLSQTNPTPQKALLKKSRIGSAIDSRFANERSEKSKLDQRVGWAGRTSEGFSTEPSQERDLTFNYFGLIHRKLNFEDPIPRSVSR